ncbi:alpha-ribazole phosphatase [Saccharicrinis sp. 156]|uniref:alpha-ribazole phosphatase n=1 Tax=Saccharicrinis sp. 156 TaxID=3417574 RepID=UPI003D34C5FE
MQEVYLIRHTTPKVKPGVCYGISDVDVVESFNEEVDDIKHLLNGFSPELVAASPLIRCQKLAVSLFSDLDINTDNRLMEMNFGDWEMKPWADIDRSTMKTWSADFVNIPTPNGECFNDLYQRASGFMDELIRKSDSPKVALVTHSGIMRCLCSRYLHIPLSKVFRLKLNYGAVIKLTLHSDFEEVEFIK